MSVKQMYTNAHARTNVTKQSTKKKKKKKKKRTKHYIGTDKRWRENCNHRKVKER